MKKKTQEEAREKAGAFASMSTDDPMTEAQHLLRQATALYETQAYEEAASVARKALDKAGENDDSDANYFQGMLDITSVLDKSYRALCNQATVAWLFAHLCRELETEYPDIVNLLREARDLFGASQRFRQAEDFFAWALKIKAKLVAGDRAAFTELLISLGNHYSREGKAEKAESYLRRAVETAENLPMPEYDQVLRKSLLMLAHWYGRHDKDEQGLAVYERLLAALQAQESPEPKELSHCLRNIAWTYHYLGRHDQAERAGKQALSLVEAAPELDCQERVRCLRTLGDLYTKQGRHEAAEPCYRKALEVQKTQWGTRVEGVAVCTNNLAGSLYEQGKLSEAEMLYKQALEMYAYRFGDDLPETAEMLQRLAAIYRATGRDDEAEPLEERATNIVAMTAVAVG